MTGPDPFERFGAEDLDPFCGNTALDLVNRLFLSRSMFNTPKPAPEGTALALIEAALDLFGTKGFAATSTRELAERSGANIASISYHFGGKTGLRRACAEEFVRRMLDIIGPPVALDGLSETQAADMLKSLLRALTLRVLTESRTATMINFVMREISEKSETIDILYGSLISPAHQRLSMLWSLATGAPEDSPETALRAFSVIGQILYFRIGSEIVMRRMGWPEIGAEQAEAIYTILAENLDALIAQARKDT